MIVAIDGPAGAGKGTLARALAAELGYHYLDTGLLYRAAAWLALQQNSTGIEPAVAALVPSISADTLNNSNLRSPACAEAASIVSAYPSVRAALLDYQRHRAQQPPGAVLDGRDIGTVVCPGAPCKLYVTASAEERARRRWKELQQAGSASDYEQVLSDITARDARDSQRTHAPLTAAKDAYILDTTALDPQQAFTAAMAYVRRCLTL